MIVRNDAACFVGVDLHKDTLTACVINAATHEVSYEKIACKCRSRIQEFFSTLPRPSCVAIETVGFYRWFWDELEPIVDRLVLADARGRGPWPAAGSRPIARTPSTSPSC